MGLHRTVLASPGSMGTYDWLCGTVLGSPGSMGTYDWLCGTT